MIPLSCQFRYCYFGDFAFSLDPMKRIARRSLFATRIGGIDSSKFSMPDPYPRNIRPHIIDCIFNLVS